MAKEQKTLNCLDSFLALFRGTSPEAQINDLIEYMIKSSYFFAVDTVNERYNTMCKILSNQGDEKSDLRECKYVLKEEKNGFLYCRYSTVKRENSPYYDAENKQLNEENTSSKTKILDYQKTENVFYKLSEQYFVNVKIDNDGNAWVRSLINQVCGYWVSKGKDSTIKNATISHIWGNASNPLYFTSLWNLVIVPTFCNFILDKNEIKSENNDEIEDNKYLDIINKVNNAFKAICWKMYDIENKQFNGKIQITKPDDNDLKLAETYINLIPADHILK